MNCIENVLNIYFFKFTYPVTCFRVPPEMLLLQVEALLYTTEMDSGAMTYKPDFIKFHSNIK